MRTLPTLQSGGIGEQEPAVTRTHRPQPVARVAKTLDEVLEAWRLVHDAYVEKGIIEPNTFGLHTTIQAARPGALVICGDSAGELTSTLTITRDSGLGLPLDDVYNTELEVLRSRGARLSEFGLFTHRLAALPLRMLAASIELALPDASSEIAIGVHPRHAGFYRRMFGFTRLSEVREYGALGGVPVCLLHLGRREFVDVQRRRSAEGGDALATQLKPEQAFGFAPSALRGTVLAHFVASQSGAARPFHARIADYSANVSKPSKERATL